MYMSYIILLYFLLVYIKSIGGVGDQKFLP